MNKEKHSNKQKKKMCGKLKGEKGKNHPKLEEAVKKWPKGFSLWE